MDAERIVKAIEDLIEQKLLYERDRRKDPEWASSLSLDVARDELLEALSGERSPAEMQRSLDSNPRRGP